MTKLRSMKRQDDSSGPEKPSKLPRTEEARRMAEEYAADLRTLLEKLRKRFN